ncbi:MAG: sulfate permease, SulP family [Clostridiales bacterium]|nr:sulfate permease, SulP family [Clostridiales bacterium]MDN5298005.1 sulfate permease, SulP family [Clostridiales bacterium]
MSKFIPKLWTTLRDYNREQFLADVTAGIIVAIIALPLSIALGIASGVTPEMGLWTAIIAGFFISFFGGSRVLIGGPTGAFMVIVYGIVVQYGLDGLIIATIMAGIILIAMGLLGFGSLIKFIPYPITTGFTSGIALVIFSTQINDFFGLNMSEVPSEFIEKWGAYLSHFNQLSIQTTLVGSLALIVAIIWPKFNKKIPGSLIALVVTTLLVQAFHLDVMTVGAKFGALSRTIPMPHLPVVSIERLQELMKPAFTIAVLGAIESLLACVVSDGMIGGRHRSNMELVAQGIANIASGIMGGIPATGAIARTAANVKNGGRTPVAGIVHAAVLFLIVIIFMPYAQLIPLSSLAAVLMIVAYNMSEWREFAALLQAPKSDVAVLLMTFFLTVLIDLVAAIEVGIILAAFLFVKRMADAADVSVLLADRFEDEETEPLQLMEKGVVVYEINGPFFFGAADKFVEALRDFRDDYRVLILRMRHVPIMDVTAFNALLRLEKRCRTHRVKLMFSGVQAQPYKMMHKNGFAQRVGETYFYETVNEAKTGAKAWMAQNEQVRNEHFLKYLKERTVH